MVEEAPANRAMPEKNEAEVKPEKVEPKVEVKAEKVEPKLSRIELAPASRNNIANEILAERSPPSANRAREFSKILARIGED